VPLAFNLLRTLSSLSRTGTASVKVAASSAITHKNSGERHCSRSGVHGCGGLIWTHELICQPVLSRVLQSSGELHLAIRD